MICHIGKFQTKQEGLWAVATYLSRQLNTQPQNIVPYLNKIKRSNYKGTRFEFVVESDSTFSDTKHTYGLRFQRSCDTCGNRNNCSKRDKSILTCDLDKGIITHCSTYYFKIL